MRLEGKTAIVTGGGRNIGRAISKLFASEGAQIAIFDMDEERAKGVVEEVVELGGEASFTVGQVNRVDDVKSMIQKTVDTYGKVDILVPNAAVFASMTPGRFEDISPAGWDALMAVGASLQALFASRKRATPGPIARLASARRLASSSGLTRPTLTLIARNPIATKPSTSRARSDGVEPE